MTREEILSMSAGKKMNQLIWWKVFDMTPTPKNNDMNYLPDYSADMTSAWLVVEKFGNRCMLNNVHGVWECYFEGVRGEAKTAPLAICRAALFLVSSPKESK